MLNVFSWKTIQNPEISSLPFKNGGTTNYIILVVLNINYIIIYCTVSKCMCGYVHHDHFP